MSLLDRIAACHGWQPENHRPFVVDGVTVGNMGHRFARLLGDFAPTFQVSDRAVVLNPALDGFAARSEAVAEVLLRLRDKGDLGGWRDEPYPVVRRWGEPPFLQIERAAVPRFGVRGFGVHLNGFVERADGLQMWIGRRSRNKPTGPGKLDHLAAGGQPVGLGLRQNMIKECAEEAGIPETLAARMISVGAVSYCCERQEGLRDDVLYCFDLALPEDFQPVNTDGEVEAFYLWPIEQVTETLRAGDQFKFNVALVIIDFLVRHGLIPADDPDYPAIIEGLYRQSPL